MTTLCSEDEYNNGNYAGDTSICKTPGGLYAVVGYSNGQDYYRRDYIDAIDKSDISDFINGWELDDDEAEALISEGVLSEA